MGCGGEDRHVGSGFGDDVLGCDGAEAGDGIELADLVQPGLGQFLDRGSEGLYLAGVVVDDGQHHGQHGGCPGGLAGTSLGRVGRSGPVPAGRGLPGRRRLGLLSRFARGCLHAGRGNPIRCAGGLA